MAFPLQNNFMVQDASRLVDRIYQISRSQGRISPLIEKGEVPEGAGYNYNTTLYLRSNATGGSGWTDITQENGTGNNCVWQPAQTDPAVNLISWLVKGQQIRSNWYCFEDLRRAYNVREQLDAQHENFALNIKNIWEDKDNTEWFNAAGYKVIANPSLTQNYLSTQMPLTPPTTRAVQGILDIFYERISVDGGCEEPYAMASGKSLITAIMSQQQHRNIIKEDASTRQDFNFAFQGSKFQSELLQSWGVDMKDYSGYMHLINILQPRYDWTGSAWTKQDYYTSSSATLGTAATVNPAFTNAAYEDIYLWHKQGMKRNMPNPGSSYGSGTSFDPVKWNGAVVWVNNKNSDSQSEAYNPVGNRGYYFSSLQAGWQSIKNSYCYAIRIQRCSKFTASACY